MVQFIIYRWSAQYKRNVRLDIPEEIVPSVLNDQNILDMSPEHLRVTLDQLIEQKLPPIHEGISNRWGKMEPQHMVEHLSLQFAISRGKIELELNIPSSRARAFKRKLLEEHWDFPRNFRIPGIPEDHPPELNFPSLDRAKEKLRSENELFHEHFIENPEDKTIHPMLGPLDYQEWLQFHILHCRHHFTQFGLIDPPHEKSED